MAAKAMVLRFNSAQPTYNDSIVLNYNVSIIEFGNVLQTSVDTTVALSDTINTISNKMAADIRQAALNNGFSAIPINNIWMIEFKKA